MRVLFGTVLLSKKNHNKRKTYGEIDVSAKQAGRSEPCKKKNNTRILGGAFLEKKEHERKSSDSVGERNPGGFSQINVDHT